MTNLIDKSKLVAAIDKAGEAVNAMGPLAELLAYAGKPEKKEALQLAGKMLSALVVAIEAGRFDYEETAPAEDMDEAAPEEEPVRFGVFLNEACGGDRSKAVPDTFSTRSEAWQAVRDAVDAEMYGVAELQHYEVRPL